MTTHQIFSKLETQRYARHFAIPNFGMAGQKKLKEGSVLVVGAGGLGSPLLLYLAAAGVGHIGIVDFDKVELTNLQRQVIYTEKDLTDSKTQAAKEKLLALNSNIKVTVFNKALSSQNALKIIKNFEVVADGTDNFPTRYLVNDACVILGKTNVYASVFRFEGQVSVFNFLQQDGSRSPNYRHLFPQPPPPNLVPNCAEGGILGVLPGIIGSMQAMEVIKVLTGFGEPLVGKLFIFDASDFSTQTLKIPRNSAVQITELIDYEEFCGLKKVVNPTIKSISVSEFQQLIKNQEEYQLIDVREPYEFEISNINGELIPLNSIVENISQISKNKKVILYCRTGKRSAQAIQVLQKNFKYENLYNLTGGILEWAKKIDSNITVY